MLCQCCLAPDRQKQAERKLVVLGRCGLESGSEPRNIGRPQQSETVRFMHVQYRALLLTRTASVGYYDGTGRNVILKLHIAAAGDKEIQLFLDIIQLTLGALAVAELDDMTEDADHDMAVLLVLIDLVGDHAHQPLLVGVERERVFDAALHDEGVERTADIVGNAEAVTALDNRTVLGGGDHDDWQLLDPAELIHALEHAEAVDFRAY